MYHTADVGSIGNVVRGLVKHVPPVFPENVWKIFGENRNQISYF